MIASDHYPAIRFGMKMIDGNIGYNGRFYSFPHFTAFLLPRFLESIDGVSS